MEKMNNTKSFILMYVGVILNILVATLIFGLILPALFSAHSYLAVLVGSFCLFISIPVLVWHTYILIDKARQIKKGS